MGKRVMNLNDICSLKNIILMTRNEVLQELAVLGNEQTKKIYTKHGATGDFYGVKVADLKKILKKTKKNHALALELFDTENVDAMYLAGLMANEKEITVTTLQDWAKKANWYMISEYTVPWIAADSPYGWTLGLEWIENSSENVVTTGWSTLSSWVTITKDEELDLNQIEQLLDRIVVHIHEHQPTRVAHVMNHFVIAVGSSVIPLSEKAMAVAAKIGKISVDMNGTACKVPLAKDYIQKVIDKDRLGKKKKKARC
jgi:3-methyladenine DNA glycosylase AlkD